MKLEWSLLFLTISLGFIVLTSTFIVNAKTITVPTDYLTIQDAIDSANSGDTIFIKSGIYYERLEIRKSVKLVGENKNTTIIDGVREHVIKIYGDDVEVRDLTITGNSVGYVGIMVDHAKNVKIKNNIIRNTGYGLSINMMENGEVYRNLIFNNTNGIFIHSCGKNNVYKYNHIFENVFNFGVWGQALNYLKNDIDISNTVNGKPIYYLVNKNNQKIPSDAGYVGLINCENITVENLSIQNNYQGLFLAYTKNSIIKNNIMQNNDHGIIIYRESNGNNILNNDISYCKCGIYLAYNVEENTIKNNTIQHNPIGIFLRNANNNKIIQNTIKNSKDETKIYKRPGILLEASCDNEICENDVTNNNIGIKIAENSFNNIIYNNNFIKNDEHVYLENVVNMWDNGLEVGGNFWDNYEGIDIDQDGRGDYPYVIDEYNKDKYPLMCQWSFARALYPQLPPIISNLNITPAEIERGDNITISFAIENIDSQSLVYIVTMNIENVNDPPPTWPPENRTLAINVELGAYESKRVSHTIILDTVGDFNVTVDWLTGSFTVGTWPPEPPLRPAELVLSDLSITPEEVELWGDIDVWTFKISVNVTNVGEQEGMDTIDLRVDGSVVDWRTVKLKGGEKTMIIYDVTRGVGSYTVEVDGLTGSFTVKALPGPAEFEFSNLVITPKKVEEGLSVTISVDVTNLSEESLWTPPILVALKLDGVVVDSKEIPPFSGGVTATQYFEVTRGEGTYEVEIEGLTGVFTVKTKLSFWDKIPRFPRFPYESIILGLIAVIIILWYARAR